MRLIKCDIESKSCGEPDCQHCPWWRYIITETNLLTGEIELLEASSAFDTLEACNKVAMKRERVVREAYTRAAMPEELPETRSLH